MAASEIAKSFEAHGIYGVRANATGEQRVKCPKCGDTHSKRKNAKDLSVNAETGLWFCHCCNFNGGLQSETRSEESSSFKPTPIKPDVGNQLDENFAPHLKFYEATFKPRGISLKTLQRNFVTLESDVFFPASKEKKPAVRFNFRFGIHNVKIKYRKIDVVNNKMSMVKEFTAVSGGQQIPYKFNDVVNQSEIIWTEGEIDALSFEEACFRNAVSVPDGGLNPGTNDTKKKFAFLDNVSKWVMNAKRHYLALDNDGPGVQMRDELARRLGKHKCFVVEFPQGCKDANDVLVKHGANKLALCIERALPFPIDGIHNLKDKLANLDYLRIHGFPKGPLTGAMPEFDRHIKFHDSNLVIVTGVPNHGKTTFLDWWTMCLARKHDYRFAVFSPENKRLEYHGTKLIQQVLGKSLVPEFDDYGTRLHKEPQVSKEEMESAVRFIDDHFFFIRPNTAGFKLEDIIQRAEYLVYRYGIKGFVIDSWMKLSHLREAKESETRYTGRILNELTEFGVKHNVNIYLVAHPTKMEKDKAGLLYKVPTLYNISGSAHFNDIADIGISVYRRFEVLGDKDDKYINYDNSNTEIHILKIREDFMGKVGAVKLYYNPQGKRFHEEGKAFKGNLLKDNPIEQLSTNYAPIELPDINLDTRDDPGF